MPDSIEKPTPLRRRPRRLPPAWIVIAVALGALGFLAAGSFLKAAQSRDSLMLRNHRALSRIADWANLILEGEVRRLASLIRDQPREGARPVLDEIRAGIDQARKGSTLRDRDLYDGLTVERVPQIACPGQPLPISLDVPGARVCSSYTVEPEGGALRVRVLVTADDPGGEPAAGGARNLKLSRRISLDRLFKEGPGSELFDKFVAADDAGNVLFELGGTAATVSNLAEALRSSAKKEETKNAPADTSAAASARTLELGSRSRTGCSPVRCAASRRRQRPSRMRPRRRPRSSWAAWSRRRASTSKRGGSRRRCCSSSCSSAWPCSWAFRC